MRCVADVCGASAYDPLVAVITRIEGTRVVDVRRNDVTVVRPMAALVRPLATAFDEREWAATFTRLTTWRAENIERDAMAIVVRSTDSAGRVRFDVALSDLGEGDSPQALIVGRHDNCDVALAAEGSGSLRHAAVVLWPGTAAGPARVVAVDLRSAQGLMTRDGRAARRMSSTTALHFGAGDCDVYALVAPRDAPFSIRFADQLDAELAGVLVDDAAAAPAVVVRPDAWERSRVFTSLGAPPQQGGLVIQATREEIGRGVVLGRYQRCHRTDALAQTDTVSRVHALLFAVDDVLFLVDTASSAGTAIRDGHERIALGEGRRIARLSSTARVFLAGVEVQIAVM